MGAGVGPGVGPGVEQESGLLSPSSPCGGGWASRTGGFPPRPPPTMGILLSPTSFPGVGLFSLTGPGRPVW